MMSTLPLKIIRTRFYDNMSTIEKQFGVSRRRIMQINHLDSEHINPGTSITIPF